MEREKLLSIGIAIFLAIQITVPLSYYLQDDPFDERFAWRMFSTVRLTECKTKAFDVDEYDRARQVRLRKHLHVAWINTLARNRPQVIRHFTERRCEQAHVSTSRIVNTCRAPSGERFKRTYERDCQTGDFTTDEDR